MAWLHAAPDPEYHKRKGGKPRRTARFESLQGQPQAELPGVDHGSQVLEWLHEVGPTGQGMNGPVVISWQEINAWKQATETAITREELVMLRKLSGEYVAQYSRSDNPNEPPPSRAQHVDQDALESQIDDVFDRIQQSRSK